MTQRMLTGHQPGPREIDNSSLRTTVDESACRIASSELLDNKRTRQRARAQTGQSRSRNVRISEGLPRRMIALESTRRVARLPSPG